MRVVALLAESVDRNVNLRVLDGSKSVALLAESVDRNNAPIFSPFYNVVALLAESVDRNVDANQPRQAPRQSLSLRRAWIEMPLSGPFRIVGHVALLAESVDRNASWRHFST